MDERRIAQNLALFSLALGMAEIAAPKPMMKMLGVRRGHRLIQVFGVRELVAGVGLLAPGKRAPWLWARVAGDVLDVGALCAAMAVSRKRGSVAAALASVLAVAVVDVVCAGQLTRENA
jgi:hypothetical protein